MKRLSIFAVILLLVSSCGHGQFSFNPDPAVPDWVEVSDSLIVSISPFDGSRDSLRISRPCRSVVCMSSSFAAGFAEIGFPQYVTGVSGRRFMHNSYILDHTFDVGSDAAMDYETLLSLQPDVVLAYSVSSVPPAYVEKLRSFGVKVLMLSDHLENTPLKRAAYMRVCGALCGQLEKADSVFAEVCGRYEGIRSTCSRREPVKVLINAPYGDAWYVPGRDSYMYNLVLDAGGEILGAKPGFESSVISSETALELSEDADVWLNPGPGKRPEFIGIQKVYDNTRMLTSAGGNDFWERGAVRPDLILSDLRAIFEGRDDVPLNYFLAL